MHLITISFDDGFTRSFTRTAEIYERHGLAAAFNVIATGHESRPDMGDFTLWNELQSRGHEIMPHGYNHTDKTTIPLAEAQALILRCLEVFDDRLHGFDRRNAVFNFPYNASSPALEAWLPTVVRAFRTAGPGVNPLPRHSPARLTSNAFGPHNCEHHLDAMIDQLLAGPEGWLIYNTHGLDDEGWGPIRSDYLNRLLARLTAIDSVRILPTIQALDLFRP